MSGLPILHRGLTPELVKRAKEELGETDERRIHYIKELKRLIKEEPDFNPCTDDAFLTRFIRARKYNIDKAFKTLKNYYLFKAQNSGAITDLKPSYFHELVFQGSILEHRHHDHSIIGYIRLGEAYDNLSNEELLGMIITIADIVYESEPTQVAGYCLVVDMSGFSLRKAKRFASPSFIYKVASVIQNCYPSRMKACHFVNEPSYINLILTVLRQFLSEKLNKRLHFHGSNMESLHKYLDPKFLPEELGGVQGPAEVNEKKFFDNFYKYEDFIEKMNKFGYTGKTLQKISKNKKNTDYD